MNDSPLAVADLVKTYPWETTPLGPLESWPKALVHAFNAALVSRFGMAIYWGAERTHLYNDALVPMIGKKHPHFFGRPVRECWPEVWDFLDPLMRRTLDHGESFLLEDQPMTLERNGYPEETWFTFGYTPIESEGDVGGILLTCVETTTSVRREREFRVMADTLPSIVFTQTPSGRLSWGNARLFESVGIPPDLSIADLDLSRVVQPDDFERLRSAFAAASSAGVAYECDVRIKALDADVDVYRWHLVRGTPLLAKDGRVERFSGSATDVHASREAERVLRERLQRDLRREKDASLAFQNASLPPALPNVAGLTFDSIYEAAAGGTVVGGDWYDVFELEDGRIAIGIGDVIGSGLPAAVTMSVVRQTIRGAAISNADPLSVLDTADRALRSEQPNRLVTTFYGVLDPYTRALHYASAGHPAPFLRDRSARVTMLAAQGLPLGLRDRGEATIGAAMLSQDAVLVLYTDGLTEASRDIFAGEQAVVDALARDEIARADGVARAVKGAVLEHGTDDVAVLSVSVGPYLETVDRFVFAANDGRAAAEARDACVARCRRFGATIEEGFDVELVFSELLGNVVRHAPGEIEVAFDYSSTRPILHVLDRGPGFAFDARLPQNVLSESGRGLFIVKELTKTLTIAPRPGGGTHVRAVLCIHRFLPEALVVPRDFATRSPGGR